MRLSLILVKSRVKSADVFNAGVGNDTIIINASNITALEQTGTGNRARVDGGGGIDTLQLEGAGLTLNLTKINDRQIYIISDTINSFING
jgi:Ca2+-binding RTX toxin-like protein